MRETRPPPTAPQVRAIVGEVPVHAPSEPRHDLVADRLTPHRPLLCRGLAVCTVAEYDALAAGRHRL